VDVLSSRILLRPGDLDRSRRFYCDVLGLAVYREFGPADDPGVVFLGSGFLEVSGHAAGPAGRSVMIWIQYEMPAASTPAGCGPSSGRPGTRDEALGPDRDVDRGSDGIRIVLTEVPVDHPLRRDPRSASAPR
jgi:catechol 2,3-dioxygenase-like lactoylglutathione lyase family enzyme